MSKFSETLNAEQLLQIVLDTIPLRVFWKDKDSKFLGANQLLLNDLGLDKINSLIGRSDFDFAVDPQDAEHFIKDDAEVMRLALPKLDIEESQLVPGKAPKWLRTNKAPLINEDGKVIGILGTYEDITAQVEYRHQIERQALLDPLTGLANRRKLHDALASYAASHAGLMFIDLDLFKAV
ncbi:MAG: PAS domain-containing protein, partial [Oceanicoccus sp.]